MKRENTIEQNSITISNSLTDVQKEEVAEIFFESFRRKFSTLWLFTRNPEIGKKALERSLNYPAGLYALHDNQVMGIVGLEMKGTVYADLKFPVLRELFGIPGAFWRYLGYLIYRLLSNGLANGRLDDDAVHIDPVAVYKSSRGMGIGSRLLKASFQKGRLLGKKKIVLEVVDSNPEAKRLYEKLGFKITREEYTGWITAAAGFRRVIHMEKLLNQDDSE